MLREGERKRGREEERRERDDEEEEEYRMGTEYIETRAVERCLLWREGVKGRREEERKRGERGTTKRKRNTGWGQSTLKDIPSRETTPAERPPQQKDYPSRPCLHYDTPSR